jgi:hypothetical protein
MFFVPPPQRGARDPKTRGWIRDPSDFKADLPILLSFIFNRDLLNIRKVRSPLPSTLIYIMGQIICPIIVIIHKV